MKNPFDLAGKVALVTGASRGLGLGFARALGAAGADLAITTRRIAGLTASLAELRAPGTRVEPFELDVTDEASIHAAVAAVEATFGKIDILVNNAGCNIRKPALDVTWRDWNTILDTNLRGSFFVAQATARGMIARRAGRIINIGSVTCVAGYAGLAPYGASRGGIMQMTMSLADDWGPHGVTVNCLAPGWFKTQQNAALYEDEEWVRSLTERIPIRRPGDARDLEGALVFLASDASAYITGQTLLVDGGISVNSMRALPAKRAK
jgi:NAD(P)-dependent dehydrogenase (short-subunit alcohol dehydrogenase family)